MEETNWIGKSGGKVSDPANWDNGVPDYRTKAVIDVDERTEITWDLKDLGIPVEILCDPEDVVIYISGDCLEGGSYFVPDAIRDHFEAFKDESLNLDELDRPPPGYAMFKTDYTWTNTQGDENWEDGRNWGGAVGQYPKSKNDKAIFDGTPDADCYTHGALTIGELDIQSGYTGTLELGGNLTVDDSGSHNGNITIATNATLNAVSFTIELDGNWSNSGTFTCGSSTVNLTGSAAQSITSGGDAFYNLTISNTGSVDITINDDLDVNGVFNCSSTTNTLRLNAGMTHPDVNTAGNVTLADGFSVTHGTGTWTFDGTATYTDSNTTTIQNIGDIAIGVGVSPVTTTLASSIRFIDITINTGHTFAPGSNDIYCSGNWTADGTFTYGTSHAIFEGTTQMHGMVGNTNKFYDLTVETDCTVTISYKVDVGGTMTGCFTIYTELPAPGTLYVTNNCIVSGIFNVGPTQETHVCP